MTASPATPGRSSWAATSTTACTPSATRYRLTLGPNLTVTGAAGTISGGSAAFDNQGTITADPTASGTNPYQTTMTLTGTNWVNHGTIGVQNGGTLNFAGSWSNSGTINNNQSTLNLGGSFSTAGLGTFTRTGGTMNLTGTLDNSGTTLPVGTAALPGNWLLAGGTINGGSVQAAAGSALVVTGRSSRLAGVTLDGTGAGNNSSPLDMHSQAASLYVTGSLILNGATLAIGDASANFDDELYFIDTVPELVDGGAGNPGTIILGGYLYDGLYATGNSVQLTLGPNLTVTGAAGTINSGGVAFDNQATIIADAVASGPNPFQTTMILTGTGWTNHGTIGVQNGGTLNLAGSWSNSGTINNNQSTVNLGGTFSTAGLGTFTRTGGIMNLTGTLDNSGTTLPVGTAALPGTWLLAGGTINGGSVQAVAGSALVVTGRSSRLAGVTLDGTGAGNSSSPLDMHSQAATLYVTGNLILNGATLAIGDAPANFDDELYFIDTVPELIDGGAGNPGTIVLGGYQYDGLYATGNSVQLTLGPNLTVTGAAGTINGGSVAFDNQATIIADAVASGPNPFQTTMILTGAGWTNEGTIGVQNGGTLNLAGSWSNSGTISNNQSTLNLGGSFSTAGLGTFTRTGGTMNLTGTLDNSGTTLLVGTAALPGNWLLAGGTINGGSVQAVAGSALVVTGRSSRLAGVTLDGTGAGNNSSPLDMHSQAASLYVTGNLILNGATLVLGNAPANIDDELYFIDTVPELVDGGAGNPGTIVLGGYQYDGLYATGNSVQLTLGPNLTVTGAAGTINSGSVAFDNQATIIADAVASGPNPFQTTMTLTGTNWVNHGTIGVQNGGTLQAQGSVANFSAGTLTGGTWQVFAGSTLRLIGGNITTNAANIALSGANANFFSDGSTTDALAGFSTNAAAGSFTLQNGRSFTAAGSFTNAGAVAISSGSTLTFNSGGSSTGTIAIATGTLNGTGVVTNAGTLNLTGGTIDIGLANQGLLVAQGAGAIDSAAGALTTTATSTIRVQGSDIFGDSVLTVANGFTNNGTIELTTAGADPSRSATLNVTAGTLTNAGAINSLVGAGLDGNSGRSLGVELVNQGTVNVNMPLTLDEAGAAHVNSAGGVIDATNGDLTVMQSGASASFTNNGTMDIGAGHAVTVNGGTFTNFDAVTGTLTGGTYNIAGTFQFPGASIVTNAANITLSGAPPGIEDLAGNNALANLAANSGSLTLTGGTVLGTAGDFSNQGSVAIDATAGPATGLAVAGDYNQSAGATTLVAGATLAAGNGAGSVTIAGASLLEGTGTINGNLVNAGTVSPGTNAAVGSLTVTGNYTQNAGGTLNLKLAGAAAAGTDYDALAVTGTASLDGTIHTQTLGGFQPAAGDRYQVMTFATAGGDFAHKTGIAFSHAFLVEEFSAASLTLAAFANPIVVDNATDAHVAGTTSLREAIAAADVGSRLDVAVTITFAAGLAGDTITLSQGPLEVGLGGAGSGAITIDASGLASPITVSGNDSSEVFVIDTGVQASLIGLGITAGLGTFGGGILNQGALTLTGDSLTANSAGAAGGALWSSGTLTVANSTFSGNTVTTSLGDGGGAIAVAAGGATITGSNFVDNRITAAAVGAGNSAGGAIVTLGTSTIAFNRFSGNTNATPANGTALALVAPGMLVADDNWWLSNTGPAAADVVSGSGGIFTPSPVASFLLLTASASPNPLRVGTQSTVTAAFTIDSAGHSIAPADLDALAGLAATFAGNTLAGQRAHRHARDDPERPGRRDLSRRRDRRHRQRLGDDRRRHGRNQHHGAATADHHQRCDRHLHRRRVRQLCRANGRLPHGSAQRQRLLARGRQLPRQRRRHRDPPRNARDRQRQQLSADHHGP